MNAPTKLALFGAALAALFAAGAAAGSAAGPFRDAADTDRDGSASPSHSVPHEVWQP